MGQANPPKQVFKVQRSMNVGGNVLIYNESRSVMYEEALSPRAMNDLFDEGEFKVFFMGQLVPTDRGTYQIRLDDKIPDDEWPEW